MATDREAIIKLDMLESLAASQKALSRIIGTVADTCEAIPGTQAAIADNIAALSRYQRALAENIALIRIRQKESGAPAPAWIAPDLAVLNPGRD